MFKPLRRFRSALDDEIKNVPKLVAVFDKKLTKDSPIEDLVFGVFQVKEVFSKAEAADQASLHDAARHLVGAIEAKYPISYMQTSTAGEGGRRIQRIGRGVVGTW